MDDRQNQGEPQIGFTDEPRWASEGGASVDARVAEAYASVHADVVRYLCAVVGRGVAEDVASQVWVEVVAGAGAFRGDGAAFRRWVLATARRRALDHRRRWWQRSVVHSLPRPKRTRSFGDCRIPNREGRPGDDPPDPSRRGSGKLTSEAEEPGRPARWCRWAT